MHVIGLAEQCEARGGGRRAGLRGSRCRSTPSICQISPWIPHVGWGSVFFLCVCLFFLFFWKVVVSVKSFE